jgi:hypothetical protein
MLEASTGQGLLENWKCLLACTLVSMSPFQYGIDFGAIGGLQAMPGFLKVSYDGLSIKTPIVNEAPGLWPSRPYCPHRVQHFTRTTAAHLIIDDLGRLHQLLQRGVLRHLPRTAPVSLGGISTLLYCQCHHDGDDESFRSLCGSLPDRSCKRVVHDVFAAVHSGRKSSHYSLLHFAY